jgi:peroxiredoxin
MAGQSVSDRLTGQRMPPVTLMGTDGNAVALDQLTRCTVIYIYPRTSPPDAPKIPGWDAIPGAKGCTPQSCGFRDNISELRNAGIDAVYGLSVQDSAYQREVVARLHLPYQILSDENLALRDALDLPTFEAGGMVLLERVTMIIHDGTIAKVFHPITDPEMNAREVAAYLFNRAG